MTVGANLYISGAGYYQIASVGGANLLTAQNLGYLGNASPATSIPSGSYCYAGGAPQALNREYYYTDFENGRTDWTLTSGTITPGGQVDPESQGIQILQGNAGSGQTYGLQLGTSSSTVQVGNRTTYFHAKLALPYLATAGDSFTAYFGWLDNLPTNAFQNGIFFYYSIAGNTPNNWGCYCRRGGSQVFSDSGVALQANTWYDLEVTVDNVYATFSIATYAFNAVPTAPVMVAQIAISQCPAPGTGLGPSFGGNKLSGSSTAPTLYLDSYEHEIQYKGAAKFRQPAMVGPAGKSSYTGTTASFITPPVSQSVLISVADTSFMAPGMQLYIQGAGTYQVGTVQSPTQVNVMNTGATGNAASSTLVASGSSVTVSGVSGPQGIQGPQGPLGPVGQGAYTTLTSSFIQPVINGAVNVAVGNSNWMAVGMMLYIQSGGYYTVTAVPNPQNITVVNPGYSGNVAPGSTVLNNSQVSSAGLVGPAGVDPAIVGSIMQWACAGIPQSWLMADGSAVSRTTYAQLYNVLGGAASPWGQGDGATTFNLPDLRGRALIGAGQGGGLTSRVLAQTGGAEMHTLSVAEMPNHAHGLNWQDNGHNHVLHDPTHGHGQSPHGHGVSDGGHSHTAAGWSSINYGTNTPGYAFFQAVQANTSTANANIGIQGANANISAAGTGIWIDASTSGISASVQAAGGGAAFNLMNPWVAVNYIIKAAYNVPVGPTVPLADTTQPGLVVKMSGLNTDYVGGDNSLHDLGSMVRTLAPVVRSYNSLGNPTFEIDARTVSAGVSAPGFALDRWLYSQVGSNRGTVKQMIGNVIIAGTNFCLSQAYLRYTLTTQEGTLGATSVVIPAMQYIEGARLRELISGGTAVSIVARASVAPMSFSVALRDSANGYSVSNLCTISSANAWVLIPIGNIPTWAAGGSFPLAPGGVGYSLSVCIASGSTGMAPSANAWAAGNFVGCPGMTSFASNPVNSTFDVGYILHEPGMTPNGPLDLEYQRNVRDCKRYYQKSVGANQLACQGNAMQIGQLVNNSANVRLNVLFPYEMARVQTVRMSGSGAGTLGQVYVDGVGNAAISGSVSARTTGLYGLTLAASQTPGMVPVLGDWDADSGW